MIIHQTPIKCKNWLVQFAGMTSPLGIKGYYFHPADRLKNNH